MTKQATNAPMSDTRRDYLWLIFITLLAVLPGISTLPVVDRDEARYAQASVQMVETGDYIDIRFQDEARHKKPVGAYWAQVGALAVTGQMDDTKNGERAIWAHRLPSVLGALIAVFATYLTGRALFGRREGFTAAIVLAVSVSLVFEAHQAKTDAMLAGAAAVALYGLSTRKAWPTWIALGAGILPKGPVIVGVVLLAVIFDAVLRRSWDRLKPMMKFWPMLAATAFTVPWFIAIGLATDGAFYAEALGRDFGGKIASAQETHGGPPGYYALTSLIMFWPGVVLLPLAVAYAWRERSDTRIIWLISWVVPMWIVLELVPTKLPHYTLPLYPALALLVGVAFVKASADSWTRGVGIALFGFIGLFLTGVLAGTLLYLDPSPSVQTTVLIMGLFAALIGAFILALRVGRKPQSIAAFGIFAALFHALAFGGILPSSSLFNLTPRLMNIVPGGARLVSPDYQEPSLIYHAGTQTGLSRSDLRAGDYLILSDQHYSPACAQPRGEVSGLNYAKGDQLTLIGYATTGCTPDAIRAWISGAE